MHMCTHAGIYMCTMYVHVQHLSLSYKQGHNSNEYELPKAFPVVPMVVVPALWRELSHCLLALITVRRKEGEGGR